MKVKVLSERNMGFWVREFLMREGDTIVDKDQEFTIVCYYGKILTQKEIDEAPIINFHPGLLPMNRGMHPQIWPLFDGSPAGVTLHWLTKEVDCGPIIAQKRIKVEPTDTVTEMDEKTQEAIFELFKEWWPMIKSGKAPHKEQQGPSSRHYKRDIESLHEFDKSMIGRIRACTYNDRSYAYFRDHGKKIYFGIKFY